MGSKSCTEVCWGRIRYGCECQVSIYVWPCITWYITWGSIEDITNNFGLSHLMAVSLSLNVLQIKIFACNIAILLFHSVYWDYKILVDGKIFLSVCMVQGYDLVKFCK